MIAGRMGPMLRSAAIGAQPSPHDARRMTDGQFARPNSRRRVQHERSVDRGSGVRVDRGRLCGSCATLHFPDGAQGYFRVRLQHCHSRAAVPDRGRRGISRRQRLRGVGRLLWGNGGCMDRRASGVIRSSAIPGRRRGPRDGLDLRQHRDARPSPDVVGSGKSGGRLDGIDPVGQHAAALALRHAADGMG